MRVYDISVPLGAATPTWDDKDGPRLDTLMRVGDGDTYTYSRVSTGSHAGTHTDAPAHFLADGATIEALPLDALVGPVRVVEHTGEGDITAADLDALEVTGSPSRVLFKTRNAPLMRTAAFTPDFVALAPDAAAALVERGVTFVGIDYLSIETYASTTHEVHRTLLGAGVVVLEGADLADVPVGEYLLACAPLNVVGAEGAPTRAYLIDVE